MDDKTHSCWTFAVVSVGRMHAFRRVASLIIGLGAS